MSMKTWTWTWYRQCYHKRYERAHDRDNNMMEIKTYRHPLFLCCHEPEDLRVRAVLNSTLKYIIQRLPSDTLATYTMSYLINFHIIAYPFDILSPFPWYTFPSPCTFKYTFSLSIYVFLSFSSLSFPFPFPFLPFTQHVLRPLGLFKVCRLDPNGLFVGKHL